MKISKYAFCAIGACAALVACGTTDALDDEEDIGFSEEAQTTRPSFKSPFPCNQAWTYSHHSREVRRALDFVRTSGVTNGAPVLASARGRATRHFQAGGAGNYVKIDHGGGWQTYYFHLSSYSVPDGAQVAQGQEIGRVGSTGASSGPHLHYEQLLNGVGQNIVLEGQALPYPGSYGQRSITSRNCGADADPCAVRDGRLYCTNKPDVPLRSEPKASASVVNTLRTTYSYFECWGTGEPHAGGNTTWYFTIGDDNRNRGWLPAVNLQTTSELDANPTAKGLPKCE